MTTFKEAHAQTMQSLKDADEQTNDIAKDLEELVGGLSDKPTAEELEQLTTGAAALSTRLKAVASVHPAQPTGNA